jgi:hypothetical protein
VFTYKVREIGQQSFCLDVDRRGTYYNLPSVRTAAPFVPILFSSQHPSSHNDQSGGEGQ